jgi:MFS family permease
MLDVMRSLTGNRDIMRLVIAYLLFTLDEYSVWIAVLVYAYAHGGATEAGVVALVQLAPAAVIAPVMAVRADHGSPRAVMITGYAAQIVGLAIAAVGIDHHWSKIAVYAGAVVAATAVTATRPAQATMLPALARTADELTAANVTLSWVESVGIALSGLWVALFLISGTGQVMAAGVVLSAASGWLIGALPAAAAAQDEEDEAVSVLTEIRTGATAVAQTPGARTLVSLLFIQDVVLGALDLLFVVVAFAVLGRPQEWAGYLNTAFGAGGLLAGAASLMLIGRRLPRPILLAAVGVGAGLILIPVIPRAASTIVLLAIVGAARAIFDVASRTLLQRTVSPQVLGRVFGMVEGLTMAGVAVGSILVPALNAIGGSTAALVGSGAILPVVAILRSPALMRLDRESRIPVVEISLLRSVDILARLPAPELEGLARPLRPVTLRTGDALIREGDSGDAFFAVADGRLQVSQAGVELREVTRGDGVGEIALLHDVPRTATVIALTDCLVYALPRDAFLVAMTGHLPSLRLAESRTEWRLAHDPAAVA